MHFIRLTTQKNTINRTTKHYFDMVSELGHRHYANYINFFILFNKTFLVELKLEYSITDGISITLNP